MGIFRAPRVVRAAVLGHRRSGDRVIGDRTSSHRAIGRSGDRRARTGRSRDRAIDGGRGFIAIAVVLFWLACPAAHDVAAQSAASAETGAPLTPGALALLARQPNAALLAALRTGFASQDDGVRMVAARITGVLRLAALAPDLAHALQQEQNVEIASEDVRALLLLGGADAANAADAYLKNAPAQAVNHIEDLFKRRHFDIQPGDLPNFITRQTALAAAPPPAVVSSRDSRGPSDVLAIETAATTQPTLRTAPVLWPGFLSSLLRATHCKPAANPKYGALSVTYRPDGRPAVATMSVGTLPKPCEAALAALVDVLVADDAFPTSTAATGSWVLLPTDEDFIACTDARAEPRPLKGSTDQIVAPKKTRDVPPEFPSSARADRQEGTTDVLATITKTGCVTDGRIARSAGAAFDLSALLAIIQWRYEPAYFHGAPVDVAMHVAVHFKQ